ncbi:hypothetical protein ACNKHQ_20085 [Shigella flexneri]
MASGAIKKQRECGCKWQRKKTWLFFLAWALAERRKDQVVEIEKEKIPTG